MSSLELVETCPCVQDRIGVWRCWLFSFEVPGKKPLGATERTINKLNPNMASTPGLEPKPHYSGRRVLSPLQPARRQK